MKIKFYPNITVQIAWGGVGLVLKSAQKQVFSLSKGLCVGYDKVKIIFPLILEP